MTGQRVKSGIQKYRSRQLLAVKFPLNFDSCTALPLVTLVQLIRNPEPGLSKQNSESELGNDCLKCVERVQSTMTSLIELQPSASTSAASERVARVQNILRQPRNSEPERARRELSENRVESGLGASLESKPVLYPGEGDSFYQSPRHGGDAAARSFSFRVAALESKDLPCFPTVVCKRAVLSAPRKR